MKHKIIFFSLIISLVLCTVKSSAQKDTLRGFVGKWTNRKTFVIDSSLYGGRASGTITIDAKGNALINTADNKKWNDKIDEQTKETEHTEDFIKTTIRSEEGLVQYNLGKECINELEKVKEEIKSYKTELTKEETGKIIQQSRNDLSNWCIQAQADYKEVMDFYQSHRKTKNEHFNLPAPPVADYNCWSCDKKKRKLYDSLVNNYADNFFKEEANLIEKALGIQRQIALLGVTNVQSRTPDATEQLVEQLFHRDRNDPSKNGPCYGLSSSELDAPVYYLVQRGVAKANQLLKENKKNYGALNPVIRIYLSACRQAQLHGFTADADYATLANSIKGLYDQQKNKLIHEKDYSQIANIPFLIGLLREFQLTGGTTLNDDKEINEIFNFCHFKLTVEMDIKTGAGQIYTLAHLKGSAKVTYELDSVKCLKFLLDKDEKGFMKLDIIANEFIAPGPHPVYIDVKQAETPIPDIDIHFCTQGSDSIYLHHFIPANHARGLWQVPGVPNAPMWINALDNYFIDQKQQAADAEAIAMDYKNNPQKVAAMKQNAEAMKKELEELRNSGLSREQMAAEMKKIMEQGEQLTQLAVVQVAQLKFPVKLQTGSETLFNETFDAKKINPVQANMIVYGYLKIKLEHDPKE
ncbi:MAG TPA: hypothetical protein VIM07_14785 [Chitinophagaceae bacterium]